MKEETGKIGARLDALQILSRLEGCAAIHSYVKGSTPVAAK
jgi:hypothetical protein